MLIGVHHERQSRIVIDLGRANNRCQQGSEKSVTQFRATHQSWRCASNREIRCPAKMTCDLANSVAFNK